jgi:hypothetical protein
MGYKSLSFGKALILSNGVTVNGRTLIKIPDDKAGKSQSLGLSLIQLDLKKRGGVDPRRLTSLTPSLF